MPATKENASAPDRSDYASSHYLLFGAGNASGKPDGFDADATLSYLERMGISSDNALTQARKLRSKSGKFIGWREPTERYCDFCGRALSGVEYEKLGDGRDRCINCSKSVVKGRENYDALFRKVREGLIEKFGIDLPSNISIQVVSTKKLARAAGKRFIATKGFDPRSVGIAIKRNGEYALMFENGVPRISLVATAAHELTHIWQYSHWNEIAIKARYGKLWLAVHEGMATWAEIQYLFLMNEAAKAERLLENEVSRNDVYGYGLRLYLNQYPLSRGIVLDGETPFDNPEGPLNE